MLASVDHLSLGSLFRAFWGRILVTWGLTFGETALFALLPLLIGHSIDGLLQGDHTAFIALLAALALLLVLGTGRRLYDTRAYGTIRVELSKALAQRTASQGVSASNARVFMGRELVDFLEGELPQSVTAIIQVIVSVIILLSFHGALAFSATLATVLAIVIYGMCARMFFKINRDLNAQSEGQIAALSSGELNRISAHFLGLRRQEVRLSDAESYVYGLIFLVLLAMLAFNLWFAATQTSSSPGSIFAIVSYSYEYVQAAVTLPMLLQTLTRLQEITQRINRPAENETEPDNKKPDQD